MTWTKEKPKKSGFYGFRGEIKGYLKETKTIVEVKLDACFGDQPYVWLLGTDESPELSLFEGEWYGPIEISEDKRIKCQDCKFWNKTNQPWHDDIYGVCIKIHEGIITLETEAIAYVTDCNDGATIHFFHTRYDFGCIVGEKKN